MSEAVCLCTSACVSVRLVCVACACLGSPSQVSPFLCTACLCAAACARCSASADAASASFKVPGPGIAWGAGKGAAAAVAAAAATATLSALNGIPRPVARLRTEAHLAMRGWLWVHFREGEVMCAHARRACVHVQRHVTHACVPVTDFVRADAMRACCFLIP